MPGSSDTGRRLVYMQYNGDYEEVYRRLTGGGAENYGNQRYVLDTLVSASTRFDHTWLVTHHSDRPFSSPLTDSITAVGLGVAPSDDPERAVRFLDEHDPTDVIIHFPFTPVLRWHRPAGVRKLALLADSHNKRGLKARVYRRMIAHELNRRSVTWVGNHGVNAARALTTWGVRPSKVVAWDYPRHDAALAEPRLLDTGHRLRILYVGLVYEDKGMDCLLAACSVLRSRGHEVDIEVLGDGEVEHYENEARRMRLSDLIHFAGRVSHVDVVRAMASADVVVVPSLHEYGEGFPLTALEALTLRTPIAASDHPMFRDILVDGDTAVVHRAGDPLSLARSIERLISDPALYRRISARSVFALQRSRINLTWGGLVLGWVDGTDLSNFALSRRRMFRT